MCTRSARGFTLVEMIVLIVVLAAALVGVLLVFQNTVRASADPQLNKQALAIGEALLDEILLTSYDVLPGTGARSNFDDVSDYNGYTTSPGGIVDINGNPIAGLAAYNASVTVAPATLESAPSPCGGPGCPVTESKLVTVTVTGPSNVSISLDGYRLRYVGP